jgi:predicted DNA-binding transcriptional regulator YafY
MQIYRLFEIVYILLHEKLVTAKSLAERFEVSQRTIYRDIDILSMSGIPVYTEKGKGGGISLLPDFVLNKSLLSEQEQIEILSALQGLSNIKTPDTDQVLSKLTTIFQRNATNWLEVDFSFWCDDNSELFNSFKTAILERRIAEFDYYSAYGKKERVKTCRRIEPIQIWFKSKSWYVKGFCLTRQTIRTFKMTRIGNLKISSENFSERDLSKIPLSENTDENQKPNVKIKLKIKPEAVDRVFDQFGYDVEEQVDGSFVVIVSWPEDEWVYGVILSYGEFIEVLEPEHLRKTLRNKLLKMVDNFS